MIPNEAGGIIEDRPLVLAILERQEMPDREMVRQVVMLLAVLAARPIDAVRYRRLYVFRQDETADELFIRPRDWI